MAKYRVALRIGGSVTQRIEDEHISKKIAGLLSLDVVDSGLGRPLYPYVTRMEGTHTLFALCKLSTCVCLACPVNACTEKLKQQSDAQLFGEAESQGGQGYVNADMHKHTLVGGLGSATALSYYKPLHPKGCISPLE